MTELVLGALTDSWQVKASPVGRCAASGQSPVSSGEGSSSLMTGSSRVDIMG